MPASVSAITKNVERMAEDTELLALWNAAATDDRTPVQAWSAFIEAADSARMADRIPGSVGRGYHRRYKTEAEAKPVKNTAAKRTTTRKATTKATSK